MQFGIVTLFPEMFSALTEFGISGRAVKQGIVTLEVFNPRDYATDKHRTVDDRPYGGGPGMLMKTEPLVAAIGAAKKFLGDVGDCVKVIYLSPQGRPAKNRDVMDLATKEKIVFLCGRYQGIDNRIIESEIDEELSIGDFVISGGELAAMALIDAMIRFQPGALGDENSAQQDTFTNGFLHCPEYTRPHEINGKKVPQVLLSGNHSEIRTWRLKQSLGATWLKRPDLMVGKNLDQEQQDLLEQFKDENKLR
mgnify:CR=1 FL=1